MPGLWVEQAPPLRGLRERVANSYKTLWLNVTCWDKLAETVEKYARKGMLVFVQGKLQMRSYKDKQQGIDRLSVEVIATVVQLLEKRKDEPSEADIPDEVLPPE